MCAENRNNLQTKKDINITIGISLCIFLIFLTNMSAVFKSDLEIDTISTIIKIVSYILGIISTSIGLYHYSISKNEEIFIISLMLISFLIDSMLANSYKHVDISSSFMILNYFIRSILAIIIVTPLSRSKKAISKNARLSIIIVVFISFTLNILERKVSIFVNIKTLNHVKLYLLFIGIVFMIGSVMYMYKGAKNKVYLDAILGCISMIFSMSCFYSILIFLPNGNVIQNKIGVMTLIHIGFIIFIYGIFYDTLKINRKKIELKEEMNLFFKIPEDNKYSEIFICDEGANIIYANKLLRENYNNLVENGFSKNSLSDEIMLRMNSASSYDLENIHESLRTDGYWEGIIKSTKTHKAVYYSVQSVYAMDERKLYMISSREETEKYNLQKKIEENENKLNLITENTTDLIVMLDKNQNITYINRAVSKKLGYKEDEVLGTNIDMYHIKRCSIENKIDRTDRYISVYDFKSKSGESIRLETMESPIYDENGILDGYIYIARDIEHIEQLNNLKIKFDEMKSHQDLKNEFFANLSHELKTPLNIFYSIIQLLDMKSEDSNEEFKNVYKQYNRGLRVNFYRMFRLINNLIDITKLGAGSIVANFANYDIVFLIEEITLSVVPYANQKNIDIVFDTCVEEHYIKCDIEKIERVILNLLSNAIKFTKSNGKIEVKLDVNDKWINISVKDNGIGIPKEMQSFIFEKFVQVDKSLNRAHEGSGMGLSIVKSLLDLHDGNIELYSKLNEGSEFVILLPNETLDCEDGGMYETRYNIDDQRITLELSDIYDVL